MIYWVDCGGSVMICALDRQHYVWHLRFLGLAQQIQHLKESNLHFFVRSKDVKPQFSWAGSSSSRPTVGQLTFYNIFKYFIQVVKAGEGTNMIH